MNHAKCLKNQVYAEWTARPENLRLQKYTEIFIDHTWITGLRLHKYRSIHAQLIMQIIRSEIVYS